MTLYFRKDAENEQFSMPHEQFSSADLHAAHAYSIFQHGREHTRNIPYRFPTKKLGTKLALNFNISKGISQPSLNSRMNPEQFPNNSSACSNPRSYHGQPAKIDNLFTTIRLNPANCTIFRPNRHVLGGYLTWPRGSRFRSPSPRSDPKFTRTTLPYASQKAK